MPPPPRRRSGGKDDAKTTTVAAAAATTKKKEEKEKEAEDALASLARAQPSTRPLFLMKATAEWVITRPDKTTAYSFWHCGRTRRRFEAGI